jgi:DNA-binding CsgD family transcriptional regulator
MYFVEPSDRGVARHERVHAADFDHPLREAMDARAFWRNTVLTDPDAGFAIIGGRGRIFAINDTSAQILLGVNSAPLYGLSLFDVLPEAIAAERMTFYQHVIRTERALLVNSVWRGVRCRERWELLPGDARLAGQVLWMLRRTPIQWPVKYDLGLDVQSAQHNDWGALEKVDEQEMAVLGLIAAGCKTGEIAAKLGIAAEEVVVAKEQLRIKTGANSREALSRLAILAGLVAER